MINNNGYWETINCAYHKFDQALCGKILDILQKYEVESLYDFGCGEAKYSRYFIENGISCWAYDGNPYTEEISMGIGKQMNLAEKQQLPVLDCVLSLEVGEHIPQQYESVFINNICKHANKLIILSWAILGQPGDGHVNCKNNDYIINQLSLNNWVFNNEISQELRQSAVLGWFKNTIMVFNKKNSNS